MNNRFLFLAKIFIVLTFVFVPQAFAEVSFCEKDPGHRSDWPIWLDYPAANPLPACGLQYRINQTRVAQCKSNYYEYIHALDRDIRRCVCACHITIPPTEPTDPNHPCISSCNSMSSLWDSLAELYRACLQTACLPNS